MRPTTNTTQLEQTPLDLAPITESSNEAKFTDEYKSGYEANRTVVHNGTVYRVSPLTPHPAHLAGLKYHTGCFITNRLMVDYEADPIDIMTLLPHFRDHLGTSGRPALSIGDMISALAGSSIAPHLEYRQGDILFLTQHQIRYFPHLAPGDGQKAADGEEHKYENSNYVCKNCECDFAVERCCTEHKCEWRVILPPVVTDSEIFNFMEAALDIKPVQL